MPASSVEAGIPTWPTARMLYAVGVACLGFALAAAVLLFPPALIVAVVITAFVAILTLREPFWGLLMLLALEFVRPQQIIPALAPLHLPRLLTMWVALAWVLQAVVARRSGLV
ncbi:MAG: hypothetical protein JSV65_12190, partial [Armatimonadota bacterium]